ncbi:MAG: hypothetical protein Q4A01_04165 [Coriobacteriales bacterium]|nr:hypothetical protein [Coriobacteriales bacterium]
MSEELTLREATARGYGSRSTLMRRIADGSLGSRLVGGIRLVKVDDLEAMSRKKVHDTSNEYEAMVKRVVDKAPPLTDEQRERIIAILRGSI